MKLLILFLPIVIGFDNFYIKNSCNLLVCGNKSQNVDKINWFKGENGVFKNISGLKSCNCGSIYYCEYVLMLNMSYPPKEKELFIVKCPLLNDNAKSETLQFHDTIEKILNKISNHNFYLLLIVFISFFMLFIVFYGIKKFELNKILFK